jgi:PKD domain-containing protein
MIITHRNNVVTCVVPCLLVVFTMGLVATSAIADVKQVSLVASRTTGVGPLPVFFDATGTDLASGSLHNGVFFWDFNDPGSTHPTAVGFTAAHVFEKPGTYEVKLRVRDTTGPAVVRSVKITVQAFTGTTYYVASSGLDTHDGRAPERAFQTFDRAMAQLKSDLTSGPAAVQVLFRRGDSFSTTTGASFGHYKDGQPVILAAYGSGPRPVIQNRGGENDTTFLFGECSGFRWVDLELTGTYDFQKDTGPSTTQVYFTDRARDFLMLRVSCRTCGQLFVVGTTNPLDKEDLFVVDCHAQEFEGVGIYIAGKRIAVIGTTLLKSSFTHLLRVWYADRGVFSNNVLHDPSDNHPERGRHALKFHGDTGGRAGKSRYAVVSDNEFKGCTWSVVVGPQDTVSTEYLEHIIIERNLFMADGCTRRALLIIADDVTVRNNIFVTDRASVIDTVEHIAIPKYPLIAGSRRVHIYNNTAVDLRKGNFDLRFVEVEAAEVQGLEIKNNILYAPGLEGDGCAALRVANKTVFTRLAADHNLWHLPEVAGGVVVRDVGTRTGYSLPAWRQLGQGQHSREDDPRLVSPDHGHYLLQPGSPAIDAGETVPAVFESMNGVSRPQGAAPDMGAFEHPDATSPKGAALSADPPSRSPGQTFELTVSAPGAAGFLYQVALALRTFPPIRTAEGLAVPLKNDELFRLSVNALDLPFFRDFLNRLDPLGQARAYLTVPPEPALTGAAIFACALVWSPPTVRVTNPVSLQIH